MTNTLSPLRMIPRQVLARQRRLLNQARQSAARYRQQNIAEARERAMASLNSLSNKQEARNFVRRTDPSVLAQLSVAALVTLLVLGGYAMQAYRAIRSNAGNSNSAVKQNLFRLVQHKYVA